MPESLPPIFPHLHHQSLNNLNNQSEINTSSSESELNTSNTMQGKPHYPGQYGFNDPNQQQQQNMYNQGQGQVQQQLNQQQQGVGYGGGGFPQQQQQNQMNQLHQQQQNQVSVNQLNQQAQQQLSQQQYNQYAAQLQQAQQQFQQAQQGGGPNLYGAPAAPGGFPGGYPGGYAAPPMPQIPGNIPQQQLQVQQQQNNSLINAAAGNPPQLAPPGVPGMNNQGVVNRGSSIAGGPNQGGAGAGGPGAAPIITPGNNINAQNLIVNQNQAQYNSTSTVINQNLLQNPLGSLIQNLSTTQILNQNNAMIAAYTNQQQNLTNNYSLNNNLNCPQNLPPQLPPAMSFIQTPTNRTTQVTAASLLNTTVDTNRTSSSLSINQNTSISQNISTVNTKTLNQKIQNTTNRPLPSSFYDSANNWVPKYIGYLKSYNATQGYGFISCDETHVIHKQDVFIHRAQVEEKSGPQPEIGQWVEFIVKSNERGQPQARNVVWLEGKIDPTKMDGSNITSSVTNNNSNSMSQSVTVNMDNNQQQQQQNGGSSGSNFNGGSSGNNFGGNGPNGQNGTNNNQNRNQMNQNQMNGGPNNMNGSDSVGNNNNNNSPSASNTNSSPNNRSSTKGSTSNMSSGGQRKGGSKGGAPSLITPPDMEGKIFTGSLKSYSQQSGYGFIHCLQLWDKYKRDIYIHRSEMPENGDYRTSMQCTFACCLNDKQQPQAKNVKWL